MTWAINVIGALCLTTLTGSVLFLFWYGIGSMLDRMGYVNILYDILRVNSSFFHTQVLTDVCWGIFRVWLLGFLWTAVLCLILCLVSFMTVFAASGSMAE